MTGVLDVAAGMLNVLAKTAEGAATGPQERAKHGKKNQEEGSDDVGFHGMGAGGE